MKQVSEFTKIKFLRLNILLLCLFSLGTTYSQTATWNGNSGTQWDLATNWTFANGGSLSNSATVYTIPANMTGPSTVIGSSMTIKRLVLENDASANIPSGFTLTIDGANDDGLESDGTFTNKGIINISSVSSNGIRNEGIFNHSAGTLNINNTNRDGIINTGGGTFNNNATINIGNTGNIGDEGLSNYVTFNNNGNGVINIHNSSEPGLYNANGFFSNSGKINIGQGASNGDITFEGIWNELADFTNNATGVIKIDNCGREAIKIDAGITFTNEGEISIGTTGSANNVANSGIAVSGTLENFSGGMIEIENTFANSILVTNGAFFMNLGTTSMSDGFAINSGAEVDGNGTYKVGGDWENNGTFNEDDSTVEFIGSANSNISGSQSSKFYNLKINKTSGELVLNKNIIIREELEMTSGNINLDETTLNIGAGANIINESASSYIYGNDANAYIEFQGLIFPFVVPGNLGNLGVEILSSINATGFINIRRYHKAQVVNGEEGILRYYDVTTNVSNLNATVRFHYLDHELNGLSEDDLGPYRFDGVDWEEYPITDNNSSANYIETDGINSFSIWTLAEPTGALPVEFIDFHAEKAAASTVNLYWQTASEINNEGFEVQHSTDGRNWNEIGFVAGKGDINERNSYRFNHQEALNGLNYYRLKQIDFDGKFSFSSIAVVELEKTTAEISVYPNPTSDFINIQLDQATTNGILQIFNEAGSLVSTMDLSSQTENYTISLKQFPKGTYFLWLKTDYSTQQKKIILQ